MMGKNSTIILSLSAALLLATAGTTTGFQLRTPPTAATNANANTVDKRANGLVPPQSLNRSTPTILSATDAASSDEEDRVLDTEAIAKYTGAIAAQMALIAGLFTGIDALVAATSVQIPFPAAFAFFFVFALKSRIFNPMSNQRPKPATKEIEDEGSAEAAAEPPRNMPEWTPPGIFFPIMWVLIIGPLRAFSSALLVTGGTSFASPAILALMLHLSIGDTWNTINNVERRYGTSVVGVAGVWVSAAFAAYQYSQMDPLAGKLLSLPLVWLTIASSLIVRTWQINPSEVTGEKESFLPTKPASQEGTITKLLWFEQ